MSDTFDPVQWVKDLEVYLKTSLDALREHPTHATLVDIAEAQFRLGIASLGAALMSPSEALAQEVQRAINNRQRTA